MITPPTETSRDEFVENKASFLGRLAYVLTPSELTEIELAYMLAKDRHRYQMRKEKDKLGNPIRYFEHPRRVALILMDELHLYDPAFVKTCLGHDLLEDTYISEALLELTFGKEACRWIKQLTKIEGEGPKFYERLKTRGSWQAMLIKLCDRLDNVRTLGDCTIEFQKKQVLDTVNHIYPVIGQCLYQCPDDMKINAHTLGVAIRTQIENVQKGF